jgi:hypothetical protein
VFRIRATAKAAVFASAVLVAVSSGTAFGATVVPRYNWLNQTVFALSPTDSYVAEWMGLSQGWTIIGGPAGRIYGGTAGLFAIDPTSGDISQYNGMPGSWTEIGGPGSEFVQGGGHLYGLGPNGDYVAEWNGTPNSWTIIGGPAHDIYAGGDGLVATGLGYPADVYHYNGTPGSWSDIGEAGADFAVGPSAVYRENYAANDIAQWTGGTTWTSIGPSGDDAELDTAGYDGLYIYDGSKDQTLKYNGTPGSWTEIGDVNAPEPDAQSMNSVYGFKLGSAGASGVYQYSGSGTNWTLIGGPADILLAAEG